MRLQGLALCPQWPGQHSVDHSTLLNLGYQNICAMPGRHASSLCVVLPPVWAALGAPDRWIAGCVSIDSAMTADPRAQGPAGCEKVVHRKVLSFQGFTCEYDRLGAASDWAVQAENQGTPDSKRGDVRVGRTPC